MQLTIPKGELENAVDKIMKKRGYVPIDETEGKTLSLKAFSRKYCYPHSVNWVKENILYRFKPDWVADLHPDKGRAFIIFEHPAARWMEKHRRDIDW